MEADKYEIKAITRALDQWTATGKLDKQQAEELKKDIQLKKTERQQIAQYFFIIAISCTILAFGAIFIDEKLLEKIKQYFALSNFFIAVICAVPAMFWFRHVYRRRTSFSEAAYEVYMVLGGLLSLTSLVYVFKDIGEGPAYIYFLFTAFITLAAISTFMRSKALWIGAIMAIMGWYGSYTNTHSSDYLFLGMNYPVRFTVFGMIILGLSLLQLKIPRLQFTQRLSYLAGLIIFFTGMWGVSIFGNYGHLDEWEKVRQSQVLIYAIIFGIFALITFYFGIKYKDDLTRDLAVMFIIINLYSRYFEYFWDTTNKGIFFAILGVSFWFIGRWLDKKRPASN